MALVRSGCRAALTGLTSLTVVLLSAPPALADRNRDDQWYLTSLRVASAQKISTGAGVTVAVIDSGVWAGHPDLSGAVLPGRNVLSGAGGHQDASGHGTAMAGIIAARGRSKNRGLLGIAPAAKVLPVTPYNDPQMLANAVRWSVEQGATVINMSFGVSDAQGVHDALKAAAGADVVLVGAVGNGGDKGNAAEFPAAYPEVLAVGAVDRKGYVPSFSQRGSQVDIVAPGVGIPTLDKQSTSGYATSTGTSGSAAIVSGAAALVRAKYPDMSAAEVVKRLTSTAKDKGRKGRDDEYGFGELDLMAALTAPASRPTASPTPPPAPADAPVAAAPAPANGSDFPRLAVAAAGVLLLLGFGLAAVALVRRSRAT